VDGGSRQWRVEKRGQSLSLRGSITGGGERSQAEENRDGRRRRRVVTGGEEWSLSSTVPVGQCLLVLTAIPPLVVGGRDEVKSRAGHRRNRARGTVRKDPSGGL
jgi:hypothetical protein